MALLTTKYKENPIVIPEHEIKRILALIEMIVESYSDDPELWENSALQETTAQDAAKIYIKLLLLLKQKEKPQTKGGD